MRPADRLLLWAVSWARAWVPGVCAHERTRNIYGDEIIHRMSWRGKIRRQVCLDCGRALNRGLKRGSA